ncbi:hypothetical protein FB192DRAFT_1463084 [Mucor lusitanicus]|uniref:C2H2-type domain-containing protein n=1 Tax=Mucor circinelloides f. lusitanicus TaxID=29924 RepID=A0A8H4B7V4_MUCCL|nr:hypothetical protein FB192DRAFT_1463084 [Mucor lusitanicus]
MTGIGLRATDFPFLCNLLRTCGVAEPKLTFYKGNKVSKRYNASYNGNVRWYMHNRPLVEARSSLGLPSSRVQLRCELCGDDNQQTFPSQSRLETHMCDVHGRDKKFPCPKVNCQNSFKTKRPLYQHVTTSHARIQCTYTGCTKTFSRKARMLQHAKKHTDQQKRWPCVYP